MLCVLSILTKNQILWRRQIPQYCSFYSRTSPASASSSEMGAGCFCISARRALTSGIYVSGALPGAGRPRTVTADAPPKAAATLCARVLMLTASVEPTLYGVPCLPRSSRASRQTTISAACM